MRVLIVDDDRTCLTMLEAQLEAAGHEVVSAEDVESALARIDARPPQVVITDYQMPGADGIDLCRRIRSEAREQYLYLVLITDTDVAAERGLEAGADDFLRKPVNHAELLARLDAAQRLLGLKQAHVTIFALARLAESRDSDTGEHLERIRFYCRALSRALLEEDAFPDELSARFVEVIDLTSPLHDIGKIGVPDSVLLKPGRLSAREYEIMQSHTTIGAEALDDALRRFPDAEFLCMGRAIALCHHERWDGEGYPRGLSGEQIPLAARIVGVADVYDALRSVRCYKAAMPHEVARGVILEGRGTHFDPRIVDCFERIDQVFAEGVDSKDEMISTRGA